MAFPNNETSGHERADLGKMWQSIPIETFMPKVDDILLVPDKECPTADHEYNQMMQSEEVKQILKEYETYLKVNVTPFYGIEITNFRLGSRLHDTLMIEKERNYRWPNWTNQDEVLKTMKLFRDYDFIIPHKSPIVNKIRAGRLIYQLIENMNKSLSNDSSPNDIKLYVYSTHDSIVSYLLNAMNIFDFKAPDYAATLLIELHSTQIKNSSVNFIKMFYINNTDHPDIPNEKFINGCSVDKKCSYETLIDAMKNKIIKSDDEFHELCQTQQVKHAKFDFVDKFIFVIIGVVFGVLITGLISLVIHIRYKRHNKHRIYF